MGERYHFSVHESNQEFHFHFHEAKMPRQSIAAGIILHKPTEVSSSTNNKHK